MTATRFRLFIQPGQHIFLLWRGGDLEFSPPLRQTLQLLVAFNFRAQLQEIEGRAAFRMLHQLPGAFALTT